MGAEQVRVVRGGALEFRRVRGEGGDLGAAGAPRREAGPQVCLEVLELGFKGRGAQVARAGVARLDREGGAAPQAHFLVVFLDG